jgi:hypothetical protein
MKQKPFYFQVEQYDSGESYTGYYLVIAENIEDACKILENDYKFKEVKNIGGSIFVKQIEMYELLCELDRFVSKPRSFELFYDTNN